MPEKAFSTVLVALIVSLPLLSLWLLGCFLKSIQFLRDLPSWHKLSKRYKTTDKPGGQEFSFLSCGIGTRSQAPVYPVYNPVNDSHFEYLNSLRLNIAHEGIYLSALFWIRPFHPPLFIPWSDIESIDRYALGGSYVTTDVSLLIKDYSYPLIFYGAAAQALQAAYESAKKEQK